MVSILRAWSKWSKSSEQMLRRMLKNLLFSKGNYKQSKMSSTNSWRRFKKLKGLTALLKNICKFWLMIFDLWMKSESELWMNMKSSLMLSMETQSSLNKGFWVHSKFLVEWRILRWKVRMWDIFWLCLNEKNEFRMKNKSWLTSWKTIFRTSLESWKRLMKRRSDFKLNLKHWITRISELWVRSLKLKLMKS